MNDRQPAEPSSYAPPRDPVAARRFRRTLVRVIGVQVITLLLLYLLQQHYSR